MPSIPSIRLPFFTTAARCARHHIMPPHTGNLVPSLQDIANPAHLWHSRLQAALDEHPQCPATLLRHPWMLEVISLQGANLSINFFALQSCLRFSALMHRSTTPTPKILKSSPSFKSCPSPAHYSPFIFKCANAFSGASNSAPSAFAPSFARASPASTIVSSPHTPSLTTNNLSSSAEILISRCLIT